MTPRKNGICIPHEGIYGSLVHNFGNFTLQPEIIERHNVDLTMCSVPHIQCLCNREPILLDKIQHSIKVNCSNESCPYGTFMHKECFDSWEQMVLSYLRSCGRARSWTDRQRYQNLWTKKGYDLAFKACGCKCGRGYLKKDLDWNTILRNSSMAAEEEAKKKKKKTRQNVNKPVQSTSPPATRPAISNQPVEYTDPTDPGEARLRSISVSSSNDSSSNGFISSGSASSSPGFSESSGSSGSQGVVNFGKKKPKQRIDISLRYMSMNGNGIFQRRKNFSTYNKLPAMQLNSYHVKIDDDGNHGNDETRLFILSNLSSQSQNHLTCVLCRGDLPVYDRYPLIDGTFFLSPFRHGSDCVQVTHNGQKRFLGAVCMDCLEGWNNGHRYKCIYCGIPWSGSNLVLGTMYSYDIFAAVPCCSERLKCNNCYNFVILPQDQYRYFSQYSQQIQCPSCDVKDYHFVKPLGLCLMPDLVP